MTRRLSITMPDDVALELEALAAELERSISYLLTQGARRILAAPPGDRPDKSNKRGKR